MTDLTIDTFPAVQSTRKMKRIFSDLLSVDIIDKDSAQAEHQILYRQVWEHRTKYYLAKAPHLLQTQERELEAHLDSRGLTFVVSHQGEILASLRLICRPFEIEDYEGLNINYNQFDNYWEIGRLVTSQDLDHITLAVIVQYLLCVSGLEVFSLRGCQGLVAICKPHNVKLFSKFGMQSNGSIYCPNRKIYYSMLIGEIEDVLLSTARLIRNEKRIYKRLSGSLT